MTDTCQHTSCPFYKGHTLCTSQIGIFADLPLQAQEKLISHAVLSTHPKDQILIREGQPIDSIMIIRRGRIKIRRIEASGQEHVLDILHDGQAIWHDMFLDNPVYHYSVVCLTDVDLCEIRREEFLALLKQQPETAMRLIQILSSELAEAKEKIVLLSIRDPKVRLAGFLLDRDTRCIGPYIHMRLDDIAASIGLRPETVSRSLSKLEKEGIINRLGQGKLQVKDRAALQKLLDDNEK